MAVCEFCGKDMLKSNGCKLVPIPHNGKNYRPIKVGDPGDPYAGEKPGTRCGDCNALVGYYHHPGCDMERCPICHGQLITCGCLNEEV